MGTGPYLNISLQLIIQYHVPSLYNWFWNFVCLLSRRNFVDPHKIFGKQQVNYIEGNV